MHAFCTPRLHRSYLGFPLRGAPNQGSAAHNFCFLMNAPKFLSFCPEPSRGARTDMGLGVGVLAASRNVLRRFIVIWIMPLRMSSALRMILGAPMPGRKVSRTNMGLGVNEVFAASLDDMYRVFGNAPMSGRKVSRTNMGLGVKGCAPMPGRKVSRTNMGLGFGSTSTSCSGPMPGRNMCGNRTTQWSQCVEVNACRYDRLCSVTS